jgi:GT2 family glycosyltransferase
MPENQAQLTERAAVREVHLENLEHDITGLQGYPEALVVFRLRGAVVGQAWIPVDDGIILCTRLRSHVRATAWPVWQQLVAQKRNSQRSLLSATVVVCTRDRTEDLAHCLPGLSRLAAQGHEVIVVDNCPTDDSTARLVARHPEIRRIHEPRPGLNVARNRGILAASGEIVAFTDDDAQVDEGWLSALLRNFDDPLVAIVTGVTMPLELETSAQMWFEKTNGFGRGFVRKHFDATNIDVLATGLIGAGANMAVRRNAIKRTGLFDEALDCGTLTRSGGDQEFFYRALARGYRIVYEPAALVWHRHRREWEALRRTIYGYGVGVFAWWTRALLEEGELALLRKAPCWFWQHHVRHLIRSLVRRPGHMPLDLTWAEFHGALAGPGSYLQSRRLVRRQSRALEALKSRKQPLIPAATQVRDDPSASPVGQGAKAR